METKGPWKIKGSRVVYENPFIKVTEDQVIRPDNQAGVYAYVESAPGVSVIATDEDQNVYLTEEFRYVAGEKSLEAVSGTLEKGETKEEAAKRELEEEAGIIAGQLTLLGTFSAYKAFVNSPAHLFWTQELTFTDTKQESTEEIEIIKLPFKKAISCVLANRISHTATVASLLLIKDRLESR